MEPVNLLEYEPLAREKLPEGSYGFIAGAAEDEGTLRGNRAAFQRLHMRAGGNRPQVVPALFQPRPRDHQAARRAGGGQRLLSALPHGGPALAGPPRGG